MTLEERLNNQINDMEYEIVDLKEQVEKQKALNDLFNRAWQLPSTFKDEGIREGLPCPRLEMRFERLHENWGRIRWIYGIVYQHYVHEGSIRSFHPISETVSSGGNGTYESWLEHDGSIRLPHRDRLHIMVEAELFNMPIFIICEETNHRQRLMLMKTEHQKKIVDGYLSRPCNKLT